MKNLKQKILVVGDFSTHIRSQQFFEELIKKDIGGKVNFTVTVCNPKYYMIGSEKFIKPLFNFIGSILFFFELVIKIPFSDKILFLAMNHKYFPPLVLANIFFNKPIIVDMYISLYDASKSRNIFKVSILKKILTLRFEWYFKFIDRLIIEKSSLVIYNGKLEYSLIAKLVNADISKSNYKIIPTSALPKIKSISSKSNKFRICWWGTFTAFHGVSTIIKTAQILKHKNVKFTLNLFGTPNNEITYYKKLIHKLGVDNEVNIHLDKTFSNGLLEKYLTSNCDLTLGNFSTSERAFRIFPTKIIDSFSMNLPVLTMNTPVISDCADINNEVFTCTNNLDDITNNIIEIIQNSKERKRRADNGFKLYQSSFSKNVVQEQFINLFKI